MRLFRECSLAAILESAAMGRKWFLLVGVSGNPLASGAVRAKDEDVDALRDAVKLKFADSHLAGIAPSDLTVFAHQEAFDAKQALEEDSPIGSCGGSKRDALIVQVPAGRLSCAFVDAVAGN